MSRKILLVFLSFLTFSGYANTLQNQLAAVAQAEQQGKSEEIRQQEQLKFKLEQDALQERKRQAKAAAIANQQAKAREAQRKSLQDKIAAEVAADKKRDQSYEDELRSLEIQKQKLALAREETRVKRENEYIDQELKNQAAHTDVIKSQADANRNISEGGRDLMKSEGKAREEKATSWFN